MSRWSLLPVMVLVSLLVSCATAPEPRPEPEDDASEVRTRGGIDLTGVVFGGRVRGAAHSGPIRPVSAEPPDPTEEELEAIRAHARTRFEAPEVRLRGGSERTVLLARHTRHAGSSIEAQSACVRGGEPGSGSGEIYLDGQGDHLRLNLATVEGAHYFLYLKVTPYIEWRVDLGDVYAVKTSDFGADNTVTPGQYGGIYLVFQAMESRTEIDLSPTPEGFSDAPVFYKATLEEL